MLMILLAIIQSKELNYFEVDLIPDSRSDSIRTGAKSTGLVDLFN